MEVFPMAHVDLKRSHAEHGPVLSQEEARAGETSGHVRAVLAVSLVLSLIAFAVLYALNV
jgi:hypothetical protein